LRVSRPIAARRSATAALDACGVGRQISHHVGQQVADLTQPAGKLLELGVVAAGLLEAGPRRSDQRRRVAAAVSQLGVCEQRRLCRRRSHPQRVCVGQPVLLPDQLDVLSWLRRHAFDLLEAEQQQVGFLRALAGAGSELGQVLVESAKLGMRGCVALQRPSERGAGVAVEGVALPGRLQEAGLVGLPVDRDAGVGELRQHAHRHRAPADVSP
jgi:hypothetical protein